MEQDKYQALKEKKSYFITSTTIPMLQKCFLEVSNGISSNQIAPRGDWKEVLGGQRTESYRSKCYGGNIIAVAHDILLYPKLSRPTLGETQ